MPGCTRAYPAGAFISAIAFMYFDMSGIVLAVVGAALILLARLFDRAQALQSELDEIV